MMAVLVAVAFIPVMSHCISSYFDISKIRYI